MKIPLIFLNRESTAFGKEYLMRYNKEIKDTGNIIVKENKR